MLVCVWTEDMVSDAYTLEEWCELLIFTPPPPVYFGWLGFFYRTGILQVVGSYEICGIHRIYFSGGRPM
jgi:hypothetical protein